VFKRRLAESQPSLSEATSVCTAITPQQQESTIGRNDFQLLGFK
jgi:hypothetical protein